MNHQNFAQSILSVRNLLQNNTIGILLGDRMNLDTAGSALALYLSLKDAGKNPQIISTKEPVVEIANLVGINKIEKSFSGNSNRVVVSVPYVKGELGKVSYKEEDDRLNFYLTAVDGRSITHFNNTDVNLMWDGSIPSVIVAFGVGTAARLRDALGQIGNEIKIINIDDGGEEFGDISLSNSSFSSVSEITAKLIRELRLPMNLDIAQNLLDGILYGTRNFTKNNVSGYAFEMAGVLMQAGAERLDNRNTGKGMFVQANKSSHPNQNNQNRSQNQRQNTNNQNNQNSQNRDRREVLSQTPRTNDFKPSQPIQEPEVKTNNDEEVPSDWLMPKVFKGSQNIDDLK